MAFETFTQCSMATETGEKSLLSVVKSAPWCNTRSPTALDNYHSQDEAASSTDAGEDITPVFADLCDFTSDSEVADDASVASPRSAGSAMAGVYSVMMLLHWRTAGAEEDKDPAAVRYGTRAVSDLPAHAPAQFKATIKSSTSSCEEASWRQALPISSSASWVAQQKARNPADDENVTRAARSILNKLTIEKFEPLFDQLCSCGIKEPQHISILMQEIFDKATTQSHFIPMYAELCVKLEKDNRIVAVVEETGQLHSFRRLLLNECQAVFEQLFEARLDAAKVDEDSAFRRKQQALGNMKLIGHLIVQGMLDSDLFPECCEELLRKHSQCAEALESLVALIMVASPQFDKSSCQHYRRLQQIFSHMTALSKDKAVAPRLRFLLRDALDARAAGWPSSSRTRERAPSKLEDVRNAIAAPTQQTAPIQVSTLSTEDTTMSTKAATAPWKAKKPSSPKAEEDNPVTPKETFQVVEFRKAIASIFDDLSASALNIPAAVQRVRLQEVPLAFQADLYVDILTRIVEERRGAVRRCQLAFIAGLAAAEVSAFDRKECLVGITRFFRDVYNELCNEVHRLPAIMKSEFMPTMLNVFPAQDLQKVVPKAMIVMPK